MAQQTCASITFFKGEETKTQRFFVIGDWDEETLSLSLELFTARSRGTTSLVKRDLDDMAPDGMTGAELFQLFKEAFSKQNQAKYVYRSAFKKQLDGDWVHSYLGWRVQLEVMLDAGGFGQSYYLDFARMDKGGREKEQVDFAIAKLIDMNENSSSSAAMYSAQNAQLSTEAKKLKQTLTQRSNASEAQEREMYAKFVAVLNSKVEKFSSVKEENIALTQQLERAMRLSEVKVKKEKVRRKKRARIIDAADDDDDHDNDELLDDQANVSLGRRESTSMVSLSSTGTPAASRAPRAFRNKKKKRDQRNAERNPPVVAAMTNSRDDKGKEEEGEYDEESSIAPPTLNKPLNAADMMADSGDSPDFHDLE